MKNQKDNKHILLVELGPYDTKHQFIEKIFASPYSILLLKDERSMDGPVGWHKKYFAPANIITANLRDYSKTVEVIARHLSLNKMSLNGVTTYLEEAVPLTQFIASHFNLPPITRGDAINLRDKAAMRKVFTEAGLPQPKFALCDSLKTTKEAVKKIGVPCIIKPVQLLASLGVNKISDFNEDEIERAYQEAATVDIDDEDLRNTFKISGNVIVEEFVPTLQEVSVEGFVFDGCVDIVAVTKKYLDDDSFQEIGHMSPFDIDDTTFDNIFTQLRMASSALKLVNTTFHAEFRLRENQIPVLIEIGVRLAGDLIPILVDDATGINMITGSLCLSLGNTFETKKSFSGVSAVEFLRDQKIWQNRESILPEIRKLGFVREIQFYDSPITTRSRYGHIIWNGVDKEDIKSKRNIIKCKLEPVKI